jgi:hypothetical protein
MGKSVGIASSVGVTLPYAHQSASVQEVPISNPTGDALVAHEKVVAEVAMAVAILLTEPGDHYDSNIPMATYIARAAIAAYEKAMKEQG